MHINPSTFSETLTKKIEPIQTRGGFVEQHWGDEMTDISADGVTGAFLNLYTGTASVVRQQTIAWDRYRDLFDLYRNNGSVYDPFGNIVLQGRIMLQYDRGIYLGYFKTFDPEETDDTPFMFKLSWSFKVQETILAIPYSAAQQTLAPTFASQNTRTAYTQPASANQANSSGTSTLSNIGLTGNQDSGLPPGVTGII
jgi:hypothetical protein